VNCCDRPNGIDGFWGVIPILTSVAEVIEREAAPVMLPSVALMVTVPKATLVAMPFVLVALLMVATVPSDVLQ
jgi:hypothetical protein